MEVDAIAIEVVDKIQDSHYDATWAIARFNECLEHIATLCRIPGLQDDATVTAAAGGSEVAMPKNYLHDLYLVTSVSYPQGLLKAPSRKELVTLHYPDQTGVVEAVCLEHKTLLFRPLPVEAETLTLFFYGKPKELSAGDDFPDYIPPILQKEIFKNYALKEAYLDIEDGIDGSMPNTQKYGTLAASAIATLVGYFPEAPKARVDVPRVRVEF
jgi:hypothetical protein